MKADAEEKIRLKKREAEAKQEEIEKQKILQDSIEKQMEIADTAQKEILQREL